MQWIVTDQIGTPRIIADRTGSLAGVKRHDYLPFGEELYAGTGNRTTALGYVADGVRQKFTKYERDIETNLDYARARYYSSAQGRFVSPDIPFIDQSAGSPQSWNLYSYVGNSPLNNTDPLGLWKRVNCTGSAKVCYESDKKTDTITSLARLLGVPANALNRFFGNPTVMLGQVFDVSGSSRTLTTPDRLSSRTLR